MTDTTRTTRPGALALEALKSLAVHVHGPAGSPLTADALADLLALLARCEAAERHAEALADSAGNALFMCYVEPSKDRETAFANLRAALAAYRAERGK